MEISGADAETGGKTRACRGSSWLVLTWIDPLAKEVASNQRCRRRSAGLNQGQLLHGRGEKDPKMESDRCLLSTEAIFHGGRN